MTSSIVHEKICNRCRINKPASDYHPISATNNKCRSHCKKCVSEQLKLKTVEKNKHLNKHVRVVGVFQGVEFTNKWLDNFWSKVSINIHGCWEWQAGTLPFGYGKTQMTRKRGYDPLQFVAHRFAYFVYYREEAGKLLVCHHCDNPPCVNPLHLFLGTYQDNNQDRMRKGRGNHPKGAVHCNAFLTECDVLEIRNLRLSGMSFRRIGALFNIKYQHVQNIVKRRAWKHV